MKVNCATCRFYSGWPPDLLSGECRRRPPRFVSPDDDDACSFPGTLDTWWCGEHQPKGATADGDDLPPPTAEDRAARAEQLVDAMSARIDALVERQNHPYALLREKFRHSDGNQDLLLRRIQNLEQRQ